MDTKPTVLWTPRWTPRRYVIEKKETGAEEGTRTPTPLRVHGPEPCASANSATSACNTRGKSRSTVTIPRPGNTRATLLAASCANVRSRGVHRPWNCSSGRQQISGSPYSYKDRGCCQPFTSAKWAWRGDPRTSSRGFCKRVTREYSEISSLERISCRCSRSGKNFARLAVASCCYVALGGLEC